MTLSNNFHQNKWLTRKGVIINMVAVRRDFIWLSARLSSAKHQEMISVRKAGVISIKL